jgi:molybdopterin molybdotransferase
MSSTLPSYDEAASIVAARASVFTPSQAQTERIGLDSAALGSAAGRILSAPICADHAMPPFPRSTRDGYACRAEEANAHKALRIAGSIRAGDAPISTPLAPGTAWEIMTGAAVPPDADAVAMLEHVEAAEGTIRLTPPRMLASGENIVPEGAEAHVGDELVPAGARLTAAQIAAAAACGHAEVEVHRKPRVAILATGDELVAITEKPNPGQIRNSNTPMLAALVSAYGGEPILLPAVPDTAEALDAALAQSAEAEMILLSGGVSAGKFDLVEPALERLGAKFHFTGARIQPGKPIVFGELQKGETIQPFFGLPGNPISSAATFLLFAAPVLTALAGNQNAFPRFALARLKREVKGNPNLTRFVPSICAAATAEVEPVGSQGSGDVAAFARADCFLVIPEGTTKLAAGEIARILPFGWS